MKNKKVIILQYTMATLVILGLASIGWFSNDLFHEADPKRVFTILCDSFMISGIVVCLAGLLTLIGKTGFFDVMGYGFKSLWVLFTPSKRALEERVHYYDYKQNLDSKERHWYPFLCISGGIAFGIGVIFYIIYCCI